MVFVEVRARAAAGAGYGGAAASISRGKQRRVIYAARHWLLQRAVLPPCRFDVVAIDGEQVAWLKAAFDAE